MQNRVIWVIAASLEAGRHIKKMFDEAQFLNRVLIFDHSTDFSDWFREKSEIPLAVLLDLKLPRDTSWKILLAARETGFIDKTAFIALVDSESEALLDRAYEAGAKTYLRKPLRFQQFVERARILNLCFVIGRAENGPNQPGR